LKPVVLTFHAREQADERGSSLEEVEFAIREADWQPARQGRQECRKDFEFNSVWNGTLYATKQVRPIFVEEADQIVVVTVFVYYF
jgi:hypothetical protein